MANLINGQTYAYYGLVLKSYKNLLNMPSRIGQAFYYWGDVIQPLVLEEDIHWNHNEIKVECIFDQNRFGADLETTLLALRNMKETTLETDDHGIFNVVLKEVIEVSQKGSFAFLTIVFEQDVDDFSTPANLPTPIGGSGFVLSYFDDQENESAYDLFRDFGIIVKETRYLDNIPPHKISNNTVYQTPKDKTKIREWGEFKVFCTMQTADTDKMNAFKKLLSMPGLRKLGYRSFKYDCFLSRGFEVEFKRGIVEFVLELNVDLRDSTISVWGNSIKIPHGSRTTNANNLTYFGVFDIRAGNETHTFQIQNDGLGSLGIGPVTFEQKDNAFSVAQQPSSPVAQGGANDLVINYNPEITGKIYSAIVKIANDDALFNPYTFKISGGSWDSSLEGVLEVKGNGNVINNGDTSPSVAEGTAFGDAQIQSDYKRATFTIKNTGTLPLDIKSITVGGVPFFILNAYTGSLATGAEQTFQVEFRATAITGYSDTVTIVWNNGRDADESHTFAVSGNGIAVILPVGIQLFYGATEIPHEASPSVPYGTSFGSLVSLDGTLERTFTVKSAGGEPITECYITGSGDFVITQNIDLPLVGVVEDDFLLRFAPTTEGLHEATIFIKTASTTYSCDVSGTGTSVPSITAIRLLGKNNVEIMPIYNFPSIADGTNYGNVDNTFLPVSQIFWIENIGNEPIDIPVNSGSMQYGTNFTVYSQPSNGILLPGDKVFFEILFLGGGPTGLPIDDLFVFQADNQAGTGSVSIFMKVIATEY